MISLDFLRNVDLFDNLNDEQLSLFQKGCREERFKNGDLLFKDGMDADHIWIVEEGKVDLRFDLPGRTTSALTTFYSEPTGNAFGWSCLVPPYKYILSAYCATANCKVQRMDKDFILGLFEEDSQLGYTVMTNTTRVIRKRFQFMQRPDFFRMTKITVHLATCGIAAGAKEVMNTLMIEMAKTDRGNITVESSGCIGRCESEPNVTIQKQGEDQVIYQKVTPDVMLKIFQQHVLDGEILPDFVLNE